MPGIERKILTFVEKHLLLIGALFSSALALYLRKIAVWWYYGAASFYFDMHPNHIQTTFYDLVVRLLQYLPALPLHSVKWLAGLSDFGVAGLLVLALGKEASILPYCFCGASPGDSWILWRFFCCWPGIFYTETAGRGIKGSEDVPRFLRDPAPSRSVPGFWAWRSGMYGCRRDGSGISGRRCRVWRRSWLFCFCPVRWSCGFPGRRASIRSRAF